jgi:hypothetical protein
VIASRQPQLGGVGWTTVDDDDDDNSHSGGGQPWRCHPLPPLPSLIADVFASLSLLALLVAFSRPETTNARTLPRTRVVVIVVVAIAVGPPRWALRRDHRWGGRGRLGPREDAAQ